MGFSAQTLHEKTEVQRGYVTYLMSHSMAVGLVGLKPRFGSLQRLTQPSAGLEEGAGEVTVIVALSPSTLCSGLGEMGAG